MRTITYRVRVPHAFGVREDEATIAAVRTIAEILAEETGSVVAVDYRRSEDRAGTWRYHGVQCPSDSAAARAAEVRA